MMLKRIQKPSKPPARISPFSQKMEKTPQTFSRHDVLSLQHTLGNHITQRLLSRSLVKGISIHQTVSPNTVQRTTSENFSEYLNTLEDKTMATIYRSWFRKWEMFADNLEAELEPLSNEAVIKKLQEKNPLNIMKVRTSLEAIKATEGPYTNDVFNNWNRLNKPNLSTMSMEQVLEQLNIFFKRDSSVVQSELKDLDRQEFLEKFEKMPVFKSLIQDIDLNTEPSAQLDQLLANFVRIGPNDFSYTMDSLSAEGFLKGGKAGDCNTLVLSFKLIAGTYLGIPVENNDSGKIGFKQKFKTPQKKTIDGITGNVNSGEFWVFENHYWIEYAGQTYDVLFGVKGTIDANSWITITGQEDGADVYGDKKVWVNPKRSGTSTRYTTTKP